MYGNIPPSTSIKAFFKYNGKTTSATGDNFLDDQLNIVNEDSLYLMYRTSAKDEWKIVSDTTWQRGIKTDKSGTVSINNLQAGEYCFGKKDYLSTIQMREAYTKKMTLFPNPSDGNINVQSTEIGMLFLYSNTGEKLTSKEIHEGMNSINFSSLPAGVYLVKFISKHHTENHKLVLTK